MLNIFEGNRFWRKIHISLLQGLENKEWLITAFLACCQIECTGFLDGRIIINLK